MVSLDKQPRVYVVMDAGNSFYGSDNGNVFKVFSARKIV
jgi:hypothetical protein